MKLTLKITRHPDDLFLIKASSATQFTQAENQRLNDLLDAFDENGRLSVDKSQIELAHLVMKRWATLAAAGVPAGGADEVLLAGYLDPGRYREVAREIVLRDIGVGDASRSVIERLRVLGMSQEEASEQALAAVKLRLKEIGVGWSSVQRPIALLHELEAMIPVLDQVECAELLDRMELFIAGAWPSPALGIFQLHRDVGPYITGPVDVVRGIATTRLRMNGTDLVALRKDRNTNEIVKLEDYRPDVLTRFASAHGSP